MVDSGNPSLVIGHGGRYEMGSERWITYKRYEPEP
jgi:hypothetical protein